MRLTVLDVHGSSYGERSIYSGSGKTYYIVIDKVGIQRDPQQCELGTSNQKRGPYDAVERYTTSVRYMVMMNIES